MRLRNYIPCQKETILKAETILNTAAYVEPTPLYLLPLSAIESYPTQFVRDLCWATGVLADRRAILVLLNIVEGAEDNETALMAANALDAIGSRTATRRLVRLARDRSRNPLRRFCAVAALQGLKDARAIETLGEISRDAAFIVNYRKAALVGLSLLSWHRRARKHLMWHLVEGSGELAASAIFGLPVDLLLNQLEERRSLLLSFERLRESDAELDAYLTGWGILRGL